MSSNAKINELRMKAKGLYSQGNKEAATSFNETIDAFIQLAGEYARVMHLAGYSESVEAGETEALTWIDPKKFPSVD